MGYCGNKTSPHKQTKEAFASTVIVSIVFI